MATGAGTYGLGKRTVIHVCTATANTSANAMVLDIGNSDVMAGDCLLITFETILNSGIRFNNSNTTYNVLYQGSAFPNDGRCLNAGDTWMVRFANNSFNLLFRDREHYEDAMLGDGAFYPNAVRDYDGNWYSAVIIGNQVWMVENLRTTHYSDGTAIALGKNTYSDSTPYYYHANGNANNDKEFGLLYNAPAVLNGASTSSANPSGVQGIAPTGWHIPSVAEWSQLTGYLQRHPKFRSDGKTASLIAKSIASVKGWETSSVEYSIGNNPAENNRTGFNAKPAGAMYNAPSGSILYDCAGKAVFASTCDYMANVMQVLMLSNTSTDGFYSFGRNYSNSHSVRCVCDMKPYQFREWYVQEYGSLQHHLDNGGEPNVQSDWDENDTNNDACILNKPGLHDGYYFPNAVRDYDGNWYSAVIIGNQVWMAENLRTKHYDDGTAIMGTSPGQISSDTPYWVFPNNSSSNEKIYGLLYNWPAIMNGESGTNNNPSNVRGIAPSGFHVPSESELEQLLSYLNGQKKFLSDGMTANYISKALASSSGWDSSSDEYSIGYYPAKNNKTGFGLKGAGYCTNMVSEFRGRAVLATCTNMTTIGYKSKRFTYDSPTYSDNYEYGYVYSSVRCVSDLTPEQFRAWYVDTYGSMQHHIEPLLTSGERMLINSDGNHRIDLTNRSVTVINFASGVTEVNIDFVLNALGDRQVVFKCDNEFSVVDVRIGNISSNMSVKYLSLRITSGFTINGDNPRFCSVSNRIADRNICVLTCSAISTASGFGSGNTTWTPDS